MLLNNIRSGRNSQMKLNKNYDLHIMGNCYL